MKQGWEIKKLGEVCESDLGKTLNQSKDTGELRPYLCAVNVLWDKIDFTTLKETRFENAELERYTIKKGDLLICEGGDIGRAAIWNYDYEIQYQNALHRVRLDDSIRPRFLLLYLKHLKDSGVLDTRYGKGVTIKHLVKSSLLSIPIPVPPIKEQERIVAELDCLSGIIERRREQLRELDALAQSIFYQMFGDPITNEKGWVVKKWEEVFDTRTGKLNANVMNENGKYPFFTCSKDIFYIDTYAFDCEALLLAGNNATANYDVKYYEGKFNAYQRTYVLTLKDDSLYKFFKFALENKLSLLQEQSIGGMTKYLTLGILHKIEFIVPPLTLQQEFAEKIEAIERQKELIKKSISETETLFNARMDYYFN